MNAHARLNSVERHELSPAAPRRTSFALVPPELVRLFEYEPHRETPTAPTIRRLPSGVIDVDFYVGCGVAARRRAMREAYRVTRVAALGLAVAGLVALFAAVIAAAAS